MITAALERAILSALHEAQPNMLPEPALWRDVNAASPLPVSRKELRTALEALANRHQVLGVEGDDYWRWRISANGQARLQELNLAERPTFPVRKTRRAVDEP